MEKYLKKQNCWEFKRCGREPGGGAVDKLGICPAAQSGEGNALNHGAYRGRICWAVAGTFCEGEPAGSFARGTHTCLSCNFYKKVLAEEGENFIMLFPVLGGEIM